MWHTFSVYWVQNRDSAHADTKLWPADFKRDLFQNMKKWFSNFLIFERCRCEFHFLEILWKSVRDHFFVPHFYFPLFGAFFPGKTWPISTIDLVIKMLRLSVINQLQVKYNLKRNSWTIFYLLRQKIVRSIAFGKGPKFGGVHIFSDEKECAVRLRTHIFLFTAARANPAWPPYCLQRVRGSKFPVASIQ